MLIHPGVLMLEDTSTNGTVVDGNYLRANEKVRSGAEKRRIIKARSLILVIMHLDEEDLDDAMRFIVSIPDRGLVK